MKQIKYIIFSVLFISLLVLTGCQKEMNVIIESQSFIDLYLNDQFEIKYQVENVKDYTVTYEYDENIIIIENNTITALEEGDTIILMDVVSGDQVLSFEFEVIVSVLTPESIEVSDSITLYLGQPQQLEWNVLPTGSPQDVIFRSYDGSIIQITKEGLITPKSLGETQIYIYSDDYRDICSIVKIKVERPAVEKIESETELTIDYQDTHQLKWTVSPEHAVQDVTFEIENEAIIRVDDNGLLYANCPGQTILKIISQAPSDKYFEIKVTVNGTLATELSVEENVEVNLGEQEPLSFEIKPSEAYQLPKFELSDCEGIEVNEQGVLIGLKVGTYTITVKTLDGSNLEKTINVKVNGSSEPVFKFYDDVDQDTFINWNKEFDPKLGIRAFDGEDGDITENIEITGEVDTKTYGNYVVKYKVTDSDGNTTEIERNIEVIWNYAVTFIGHAGCYYGVMNSEEAILYAATVLKYQAIEIDLKQTKDGVFILSHDPTFGNYNLEDYTWDELKDKTVTVTRNSGFPEGGKYTAKLCTLERYLEICKQYNITAVIELKTSKGISNWTEKNSPSSSRMPALIKQIEEAGMINNVIFLTSQYECLAWTRKNGYEFIECQYLVSSCESEEYLEICKKYDLDISMNVRDNISNSEEWLKKYKDAGLKIAAYTFEQYATYDDIQMFIDRGYDYVTTDWHEMDKCNLPEKE